MSIAFGRQAGSEVRIAQEIRGKMHRVTLYRLSIVEKNVRHVRGLRGAGGPDSIANQQPTEQDQLHVQANRCHRLRSTHHPEADP